MPRHESEQTVVVELTAAALDRVAPDELVLLDETAEEYFADPQAVLDPRRRDEAVGFGAEFAMIAPYLLAVATPVVAFLFETVSSAAQDATRPALVRAVRRLLRLRDEKPEEDAAVTAGDSLTVDQIQRVREIAYGRALALGLSAPQSDMLADAIAGGALGSAVTRPPP